MVGTVLSAPPLDSRMNLTPSRIIGYGRHLLLIRGPMGAERAVRSWSRSSVPRRTWPQNMLRRTPASNQVPRATSSGAELPSGAVGRATTHLRHNRAIGKARRPSEVVRRHAGAPAQLRAPNCSPDFPSGRRGTRVVPAAAVMPQGTSEPASGTLSLQDKRGSIRDLEAVAGLIRPRRFELLARSGRGPMASGSKPKMIFDYLWRPGHSEVLLGR